MNGFRSKKHGNGAAADRGKASPAAADNRKATIMARHVILGVACAFFAVTLGVLTYRQGIMYSYYCAQAESVFITDSNDEPLRGSVITADGSRLSSSSECYTFFCDNSELYGKKTLELDRLKYYDACAFALSRLDFLNMTYTQIFDKINTPEADTYIEIAKGLTVVEKDQITAALEICVYGKITNSAGKVDYWDLNDCSGIFGFEKESVRYYGNEGVASALLGFLNSENDGVNGGVEEYCDLLLKGESERTVSLTDRYANRLLDTESEIYTDKKQQNVILNINYEVQKTMEDELTETADKYGAEGGVAILMDVNTFDIVGMAGVPDYDINNKYDIPDDVFENLKLYLSYGDVKDKTDKDLLPSIRALYWANRAINQNYIYEPGSVNKILTVSAALDAGVIDENIAFSCTPIDISGKEEPYRCHAQHYNTCLGDCLRNSCNPFAVQIAYELGTEKYYDYLEAYGYTEKTGIDLPGEFVPNSDTIVSREDFDLVTLCSYSFGQTLYISPLQLISMVSAAVNGGYLMVPHVVDRVEDDEGNIVYQNQPVVKRQVISNETSAIMRKLLRTVVTDTTAGGNVAVSGYDIGGKSGTSEDLVTHRNIERYHLDIENRYWASFCSFFPAETPEYALLVVIYKIPKSSQHGGSVVAGSASKHILTKILPVLGVSTVFENDEIKMPSCVGLSVDEAKAKFDSGMTVKVIGSGDTVTLQTPVANSAVPENGIAVLYTEGTAAQKTTVPHFIGMTVPEAKAAAAAAGLNVKVSGDSHYIVDAQKNEAGLSVSVGTVIILNATTTENTSDG